MIGGKWAKSGVTGERLGEPPHVFAQLITRVFGTGLGTGYAPVAQGTAGSAVLVILWWFFMPELDPFAQGAAIILLTAISIPLSNWGERMWGEDPGRITVDEFAGQAITLFMVPHEWPAFLAAFILFRLFDTFKLPFIRNKIEPIPDGWGVTLDDVLAGALGRICMVPVLLFI
ncbi:phosphatidylglycerophosphatase A [bacterium]|nr:phosphatidylglycerophosphatase A [bacterium]